MSKKTLLVIIVAIIVIIAAVLILSASFPSTFSFGEKIAVIKLEGTISSSGSFLPVAQANPKNINELLDKAESDPTVRAVLLEINSPGGSPVASDEISAKIDSMNKTVVAYIGDIGTSGAYWVASSSDKIVVHPLAITCSIGAFTTSADLSEFFNKIGFNYTTVKSGELKDIGSPFRPLTEKEKEILQSLINQVQNEFVNKIKTNRNLNDYEVSRISDGRPCLGKEAVELGLADETGTKGDAIKLIKKLENLKKPRVVEFSQEEDLFGAAFGASLTRAFYALGLGIGAGLKEPANTIVS